MTKPVHYHFDGFPPTKIDWKRLVPLIGEAHEELARYDAMVMILPNANALLSPFLMREAVLSSKIEGTNATISEVLEIEAGSDDERMTQSKRDDAEEILNYRQALSFAANALADRPLSLHLLREAHSLLMEGVRGRDKHPGAFRTNQNWIGTPGGTIDEASFVPIPQEHLLAGLDRWSDYVKSYSELDPLVQLAIIHVEFEALHPFEDGNGRLGRIIIPLFLYARRILSRPIFYISSYLEARREKYIEAMAAVSRDGAWTEWCAFFLRGVISQVSENRDKVQAILDLHQRIRHEVNEVDEVTQWRYVNLAVDFMFSHPVFPTSRFMEDSNIPRPTASKILQALKSEKSGLLSTVREGSGRRPAILAFTELLDVAESRRSSILDLIESLDTAADGRSP